VEWSFVVCFKTISKNFPSVIEGNDENSPDRDGKLGLPKYEAGM
jgi:hypothetical protein